MQKLRVRDVMTQEVVTVDKDRNLKDVMDLMERHGITKIPVTEGGELVGVATDGRIADKLGRAHNKNIQTGTLHASSVKETDVVTVHPDEPIANLLHDVGKPGLTMIPVVQDRKVVGVVTKADLLRFVDSEQTVEEIMKEQVTAVTRGERIVHARRLLLDNDIARLPVVEEGRPVGIIAEHEIAAAFANLKEADMSVQKVNVRELQVGEHMREPVVTIHPKASAKEAAQTMLDHDVGGLPVVNGAGTIEGIVTRTDLIQTFVTATA